MNLPLDQRPVIVALAGPNGAGKTTFYESHLKPAALRFVNADVFAREINMDAYAAEVAARLRHGYPLFYRYRHSGNLRGTRGNACRAKGSRRALAKIERSPSQNNGQFATGNSLLPFIYIFDNSDLENPYILLAEYQNGEMLRTTGMLPPWFARVIY